MNESPHCQSGLLSPPLFPGSFLSVRQTVWKTYEDAVVVTSTGNSKAVQYALVMFIGCRLKVWAEYLHQSLLCNAPLVLPCLLRTSWSS